MNESDGWMLSALQDSFDVSLKIPGEKGLIVLLPFPSPHPLRVCGFSSRARVLTALFSFPPQRTFSLGEAGTLRRLIQ